MSEKITKDTCIAHRTLAFAGSPETLVDIFIAQPEKVHEEKWIYRYRIVGAGEDMDFQVHGIDAVQALKHVFVMIDAFIVSTGLSLTWLGEKDLGFLSA
ncbi:MULTISPECIES: hypothetical protein [unclassified Neisseria]|uniref:DUF6968 family protein n=1 Tax=unclassified Neisseria TaxID=2623750 RepID=UPI001071D87B|nr:MULTISPECIES: hypothetical protein [unclassified Neisseria]MBF0804356.1 hypothetical protein [Neisseria sp. 19428wB4_WF04]TFU42886.1 hypothetical protein E4T99_08400 [Neisseria sp. WF04]